MAAPALHHIKDDSIAFIDDVSEKSRLVEDSEDNTSVENKDINSQSPTRAKNLANAKNGVPGVHLSSSERGKCDQKGNEGDEVIDDSETAKLLGSNEKIGKDSSKEDVGEVVVTKAVEKIVSITKVDGKTEIIIERSNTVVENIVNLSSDSPKKDKDEGDESEKEEKRSETPEKTDVCKDDKEDVIEKMPDPILIISPAVEELKKEEIKAPVPVEIPRDVITTSAIISDITGDRTPSEAASDTCTTDTYDLYQTVGSVTPNSLSNADVFRSFAVTLASSEGTFISAESALGSTEDAPTSLRSQLATEMGSVQLESVDLASHDDECASQKSPEHVSETKVGIENQTEDADLQREVTFEGTSSLKVYVLVF